MILQLVVWIFFGLFVGAVARLLLPGSDPLGCLGTIVLGVIGSVVGGFFATLLFGGEWEEFQPAGFLGAVLGAILVLLIVRQFRPAPLE